MMKTLLIMQLFPVINKASCKSDIRVLLLLNFNYETKYKSSTLFTKKEWVKIENTFKKAKWEVVSLKLEALLKRNFLYETFSNRFLRRRSFVVLWEGKQCLSIMPLYQMLTKNPMTFAGRCKKNVCSEKF